MKERVIQLLKNFGVQESALAEQNGHPLHFNRDLGFDSLDSVDLIMQLEQEFGIRIPDEDYPKLTTLQGVYEYLQNEQQVAEVV
ncbi:phosphopantetheine-binding protein [Fibrisoma limi BUZ 3]|uniref:Phosphopantetheine-binding protein n=1 Tax=Fibrisoma limi BUZ 3 TaxID=1185876 RepID=I2GC73_9BACT|nr:acyl carrier protein [Fibrisoma limi]CCH51497.1 phosphopantetheine-binding protein [Fibrisoma limi BUZ 3]